MNENKTYAETMNNEEYFNPILSFFNDTLNDLESASALRADVTEEENAFRYEIDVPGVEKSNIKVSLDKNYLVVNVKNDRPENKNRVLRSERAYGNFTRTFYVGDKVSKADISAEVKHGVLTIMVSKPKAIPEEEKAIEIR